jgi:hypothetical protein
MKISYIYLNIIKNKYNYNIIIFNIKNKIFYILNINYKYIKNKIFYKLLKNYLNQNGIKHFYLNNWSFFGIKYNLIYNLIK